MEIPFYSGPTCMPHKGTNPADGYVGCCPPSSISGLPWWASRLQGGGWKALKQYIEGEQARTSNLNSPDITNTDPKAWPVA